MEIFYICERGIKRRPPFLPFLQETTLLRGSYRPCLRHLSPSTVSAGNSVSAGSRGLWELALSEHTPLRILISGALRKQYTLNSLQQGWTLSTFIILILYILHQVSYKISQLEDYFVQQSVSKQFFDNAYTDFITMIRYHIYHISYSASRTDWENKTFPFPDIEMLFTHSGEGGFLHYKTVAILENFQDPTCWVNEAVYDK